MSLTLFKNAKLLDPTRADLQDGVRRPRRGLADPGGVAPVDPHIRRDRRRRRRPDAHAGADRLPRPRVPAGGQHPGARGRAPHPADGAGRAAHARHAGPRLHDGPGHGRRGLGHPGGRRAPATCRGRGSSSRGAPSARRAGTATLAAGPTSEAAARGERHGLHHGDRRRRGPRCGGPCASSSARAPTTSRSWCRAAWPRPTTRSTASSTPPTRSAPPSRRPPPSSRYVCAHAYPADRDRARGRVRASG